MWNGENNYDSNSNSFTALSITYSIMGHERTSTTEAVGIFSCHTICVFFYRRDNQIRGCII